MMLLVAHVMLPGAYVMLLGAQTVQFGKDACLLFRQELEIDVFGEMSVISICLRWLNPSICEQHPSLFEGQP